MAVCQGLPHSLRLCVNSCMTHHAPRLFETIIYWVFYQNVIFYFTRNWNPSANNKIWWIFKVLAHSKTLSHFFDSLFTLKLIIGDFYKFRSVAKCGRYSFVKLWLCLNIDYVVWFVSHSLKLINKILLMVDVSFEYFFFCIRQ